MPYVSRLTDIDTGHGCYPPRPIITASPNVTANGLPMAHVGSVMKPHSCLFTHSGSVSVGSSTVSVNGHPVARIGDAISCGGVIETGGYSVLVGG